MPFRIFLFLLAVSSSARAQLLPHIGSVTEPGPELALCDPGDYFLTPIGEDIGYAEGSFVNDFTAFGINGEQFSLSNALSLGKPVLLVSASYTCPVFRNKVPLLSSMQQNLADQLTIAVIYTVEAHPTDVSPYFGYVNTGEANQNAGILYAQPTTYGERLAIAQDMMDAMNIGFPLYLDGACNEWLENFGPAPNMGYLLDTEGRVMAKHPWFHSYPDHIFCDLESLIVLPQPPNCELQAGGSFNLEVDADTAVSGNAGSTLYAFAQIVNSSDENVLVSIERVESDLPPGWSTSICTDICLSPGIENTEVLLSPGEVVLYTNYFYTSGQAAQGSVTMRFSNAEDSLESFTQVFSASTLSLSLGEPGPSVPCRVFPNPVHRLLAVSCIQAEAALEVWSPEGRFIMELAGGSDYGDVSGLSPGIYHLRFSDDYGSPKTLRFIKY